MHECRIYKGHPDQGGELKKVIPPDECQRIFYENIEKYEYNTYSHRNECDDCGVEFVSLYSTLYCAPCRAKRRKSQ